MTHHMKHILMASVILSIATFPNVTIAEEEASSIRALQSQLHVLQRDVQYQKEVEAVKAAVYRYGRWVDRVMTLDRIEDIRYMAEELHTKDGVVRIDPRWSDPPVWGPSKDDLIKRISEYSKKYDWAYHYYTNPQVEVDLDKSTAHFRAIELVPIRAKDGNSGWAWVANESILRKEDGAWKFVQYGPVEIELMKYQSQWPSGLGDNAKWFMRDK